MGKVKVGIIGCGNISGIYFQSGKTFDIIDIVACADLMMDRAKKAAADHGVPKACTVEELLADPEIQIVVNLTIPGAHAEVALKTLEAGKSTHGEKPLAVTREDGQQMLDLAASKGLRVGCAPDTFMGAGIQTCRKLIDDGWIGEPVGATAFMLCPGHESWHPDPEFYYKKGGGPVFDMGPYYLTALVNLLGPVKSVMGYTRTTHEYRTITSAPKFGTKVKVDVPTHVAGTLEFGNGALGTIIQSFDVHGHHLPNIEIYGTEGSIQVPDPNGFGGPVFVKRGRGDWKEMPLSHIYHDNSRGIGVADMAYGLISGREHRASGDLAFHVLDIMHALHDSSDGGRRVKLKSKCKRPAAMPMGLVHGFLDE